MVDYAKAIPMYVDRSRVFQNAAPGFAIVIHKTAGFNTVQELCNYFATTSLETSSHYGVGLDGTVAQFVAESDGAAGNCCTEQGYDTFWNNAPDTSNLNFCTISIEHIDPSSDNSTTPPQAQLDASFALVLDICTRHGIDASHIKTHASIAPLSRARCPGNYPMTELIAYVEQGGTPSPQPPTVNDFMRQAAQDEWNSFFQDTLGKTPPPSNTGIAASWESLLFDKGWHVGPPITGEYSSVDWNGNKITVQQFADGRCEWNPTTNKPAWYSTNGQFA